jgi:hypothetical protein
MNAHPLGSKVVAGLMVGGLVIGTPAAAMAATASPATQSTTAAPRPVFVAARKAVEHALALRQDRLAVLTGEVASAKTLTPSDRSRLAARVAAETAGIDALAVKVPRDETWLQLGTDAKKMVLDYRVFVVMSPQVHLTISADTETAVESGMQKLEPGLEAAIEHAQAEGENVRPAKIAYAALVDQVDNAESDSSGVAVAVLATSPAGYPGNMTVFVNARSSLVQGRTALVTARSDIETIVTSLGL